MDEVWRRGSATVRDVLDELNGRGRRRAYTTIMTIMSRLHGKGLLERSRDGRTDVYTSSLSREEYVRARAAGDVDALVERYGDEALDHLADALERRRR